MEGMGTELSWRSKKEVLGDLFSKITRFDLDGKKGKSLRDSQVEIEIMVVRRIPVGNVGVEMDTKVIKEKDRLNRVGDCGEDVIYDDVEKGAAQ